LVAGLAGGVTAPATEVAGGVTGLDTCAADCVARLVELPPDGDTEESGERRTSSKRSACRLPDARCTSITLR
jgi:hypothetical protein